MEQDEKEAKVDCHREEQQEEQSCRYVALISDKV